MNGFGVTPYASGLTGDAALAAVGPPASGRRISIVGASGSGKSRIARQLAEATGVTHYELDHLRNGADGERLSDEAFAMVVAEVVARDEWIIDGHYRSVRHLIWDRASQVVWLDYPMGVVLKRLWGRYRAKSGASRTATPGRPPQPPGETASWSSRVGRLRRALSEKREYGVLLGQVESAGTEVIRLQDPATADTTIAALVGGKGSPGNSHAPARQLIELLGVPGSGKSTISDRLAIDLGCPGRKAIVTEWRSRNRAAKTWYIARSLADLPAVWAAIRFARCARLTSRANYSRLVRMIAKRHWVNSRRGTVLLHQGYLQDIWSILAFNGHRKVDEACVSRLIAALYRGTVPRFIYLDVAPQTAAERIIARIDGNSRLDAMPEQQIHERLVEHVWVADLICAATMASGLPITRIGGEDAVDRVAASAALALQPA